MAKEISWVLVVEILPGQLDHFHHLVDELVASAETELGTLTYQWHLSEDDTVCHIYERYANSAALITHGETFGAKFAERFFKVCRPTRLDVYGNPSLEARAAIADLKPTYYLHLAGFTR